MTQVGPDDVVSNLSRWYGKVAAAPEWLKNPSMDTIWSVAFGAMASVSLIAFFTNIVESPFNAVRLRTDASRRFKKTANAEAMIWKLLLVAQKSWRALNAPHLMKELYDGKRFKDGIAVRTMMEPTRKAA
jgi:hypothetical protein